MLRKKNKLTNYFRRNGYFRVPDKGRREDEGSQVYKKGYEIRFVAKDDLELGEICRLLKKAGLQPGKIFFKTNQIVQPVYGKKAVEKFRKMLAGKK